MSNLEDPFRVAEREIEKLKKETPVVIIDFHAEATSEKIALAWHLDGKASAVIGTHTHVQTADERILTKGTAFITDAGMTGPTDSVIGVKKEQAIARFLYQTPHRFEIPKGPVHLNAVLIDIDEATGKANSIERIHLKSVKQRIAPRTMRVNGAAIRIRNYEISHLHRYAAYLRRSRTSSKGPSPMSGSKGRFRTSASLSPDMPISP